MNTPPLVVDTPLLAVKSLSKNFGGTVANNDISLQVSTGDIVGIIGPNGSGKSTLFNLICGTLPADAGSILLNGHEITQLPTAAIARSGIVRTFQQTRIYHAMSCIDNMRISAPATGGWLRSLPPQTDDDAMELLSFVGLEAKHEWRAGEMSFGQQKLLELAMALIARPTLLLLDEPTAGINPTLINGVLERLKAVNQNFGITLIVIEHNMTVIMNLAHRIYCLAHGQMLAEGLPAQIRDDPRVIDAYLGR